MHEVVVMEPGFCTPRIVMQRCLKSGKFTQRRSLVSNNLRGFHDHCDTPRLDSFLDSYSNLLGEALLDLQAAAECLSDPCKLGQAENELIWDVGNRNLTQHEGKTQLSIDEMIGF